MANDSKRRRQHKGRGSEHSFLGIPHYILRSPEFGRLTGWDVKLLIEFGGNYRGKNNGDLSAAFSVLKTRGWNSAGTLNATIQRLVRDGWIIHTRQGSRNRCALFALTWWPLDECPGKWLEISAEVTARHSWKTDSVVAMRTNVVAMRCSQGSGAAS